MIVEQYDGTSYILLVWTIDGCRSFWFSGDETKGGDQTMQIIHCRWRRGYLSKVHSTWEKIAKIALYLCTPNCFGFLHLSSLETSHPILRNARLHMVALVVSSFFFEECCVKVIDGGAGFKIRDTMPDENATFFFDWRIQGILF